MAKNTTIILLFIIYFAFGCAKKVAPEGGPIDNIPPEITYSFPQDGDLNFSNNYFEFEFSEYVDKNKFRTAFFISPAIIIDEFDWSGTSVRLYFSDTLRINTTYSISISTEITDLNNKNKMKNAFNLAFSTGNKIDNGKISGQIFGHFPDNTKIFAYKLVDSLFNLSKNADYISLPNLNGNFNFGSLKTGNYNIFAIQDNNNNSRFDINSDKISITKSDFFISDSAISETVKFIFSDFDTTKPRLEEVVMTDNHHFQLTFSEITDSSTYDSAFVEIYDSTRNMSFPFVYKYKGNSKKEKLLVSFPDSIISTNKNYLITKNFSDKYGNLSTKSVNLIYFNEKSDTNKPKILSINFANQEKIDYLLPYFTFLFDEGISELELVKNTTIYDFLGKQLEFSTKKVNDAEFQIHLKNELKQQSEIKIIVNLQNIKDAAGNYGDTSFTKSVETLSSLDFVSLSGKVENVKDSVDVFVILKSTEKNNSYKTKVLKNKYQFDKILPSKYQIFAFCDKNGNCVFDNGKPFPFAFAEPFTFIQDTINVRPRWPITDVNLKFNKEKHGKTN